MELLLSGIGERNRRTSVSTASDSGRRPPSSTTRFQSPFPTRTTPLTKSASSSSGCPASERRTQEMREEYDFSGGVHGKYVGRYRRGTNVALIDPELAEAFPDPKSVNDALRALVAIATRAESRKRA